MDGEERSTLERDLEDFLVERLECLEPGLSFQERQVQTEIGVIDIVARDAGRNFVIIELKAGEAGDAAVGQIMRYMAWYGRHKTPVPVRGFVVAFKFTPGALYAASLVPRLTLLKTLTTQFEIQTVLSV